MEIAGLALAGILLFVIAFLFGKDYAECVAELRNIEKVQRLRATIAALENAATEIDKSRHTLRDFGRAAKRVCPNGPERCLCDVCAPTEHQQPGGFQCPSPQS